MEYEESSINNQWIILQNFSSYSLPKLIQYPQELFEVKHFNFFNNLYKSLPKINVDTI